MTDTQTPMRSVKALRDLADWLETHADPNSLGVQTLNHALSDVPAHVGETEDWNRLLWIISEYVYRDES